MSKMVIKKNIFVGMLGILLVIFLLIALAACFSTANQEQEEIERQLSNANLFLGRADYQFLNYITVETMEDESGNQHVVGVMSPELDRLTDELLKTYNQSVSSSFRTTEEELSYMLTDGIIETIEDEHKREILNSFLLWTAQPADLVYIEDEYYGEVLAHVSGDEVSEEITNFNYILNSTNEEYANYRLIRE